MSERESPWDFPTAIQRLRSASRAQEAAEDTYRTATREFAEAEESYRVALAVEIVTAHNDGVAWSTAPDLARGDVRVAGLRKDRDIKKGVMDALEQALWRRIADRKDCQRAADWSQRREFAEAGGHTEPNYTPPIGGQQA